MSEFPYETRLDILHGPMELFDINELAASVTHPWFNQTLCQVNESVVRVAVAQGEYHWHKHDDDDEFFCLSGEWMIDFEEDRSVSLKPGMGFVVPKGVLHRPRAPQRTVVLMVETKAIIPTGD